jgi:hypothetical protein
MLSYMVGPSFAVCEQEAGGRCEDRQGAGEDEHQSDPAALSGPHERPEPAGPGAAGGEPRLENPVGQRPGDQIAEQQRRTGGRVTHREHPPLEALRHLRLPERLGVAEEEGSGAREQEKRRPDQLH